MKNLLTLIALILSTAGSDRAYAGCTIFETIGETIGIRKKSFSKLVPIHEINTVALAYGKIDYLPVEVKRAINGTLTRSDGKKITLSKLITGYSPYLNPAKVAYLMTHAIDLALSPAAIEALKAQNESFLRTQSYVSAQYAQAPGSEKEIKRYYGRDGRADPLVVDPNNFEIVGIVDEYSWWTNRRGKAAGSYKWVDAHGRPDPLPNSRHHKEWFPNY